MQSRHGPHPAPAARRRRRTGRRPPPAASHTTPAPPQVAQVFRIGHPPRGAERGAGIGVARLPGQPRRRSRAMRPGRRRTPPPSTPPRRADAQLYGTNSTRWVKPIRARADRRQQRLLGAAADASPSHPARVQPAAMESRHPGIESRPQETRSDNVNGHDPDRDTRPRPSARRLPKEAATGVRRLRRSERRHRPPPGPAAVGKESP